jgi:hypothetical protein
MVSVRARFRDGPAAAEGESEEGGEGREREEGLTKVIVEGSREI